MKYFTKIRITWIIAIALIAINATMISLSLFNSTIGNHENKQEDRRDKYLKKECILRSELKLSKEQTIAYDSIKNIHHLKATTIVDSLQVIRTNLMAKLKKEVVGDHIIDSLVNQINFLNSQLFTISIEQYLDVKQILDSNQQESLSKVYCEMFGCSKKHKGCDSNKFPNHKREGRKHDCD